MADGTDSLVVRTIRGARMDRDAVVVGGGLAGTLAVGALLGQVDRVTLVERDRFPVGPEGRKGVPQGRHLHVFLSGGQRALDELLPGVGAELAAAGAHRLEMPRDILTRMPGGWQRRFHEGRHALVSCTRPLLDHVVRARVLAEAAGSGTRLEIVEGAEVVGLLGDEDRVTGVRIQDRGRAGERDLAAAFVVDASGRGSRAPEWLAGLGRAAPREEVVDAGLAYATRMFRLAEPPDAGVYIMPTPDVPRGGAAVPVEDGRWLVTLSGERGHEPPTGEGEFLDFAASLAHPYLYGLIKTAEPVSGVHGFRNTANRRRHYDAPGGVPEGFVAIADAACAFNPVYGQGMAVAALSGLALRDVLANGGLRPGLAAEVQGAAARAADTAWLTATAADRPRAAAGAASLGLVDRLKSRYFSRLTARVAVDPTVGAAYRDLLSLTVPLSRLLTPAIAARVLLLPRRRGLADPPLEVGPGPDGG
ncbi:FAD-dependent oxidoreductase [Streptomyces sp. NBC_01537]|uniref:NAD(P)/FAD-dependent oxidoreductase n=1 Tax=Streptomyces sp. NBC_01537 TaxID=2903896 RepID=UPI00386FBDAC